MAGTVTVDSDRINWATHEVWFGGDRNIDKRGNEVADRFGAWIHGRVTGKVGSDRAIVSKKVEFDRV